MMMSSRQASEQSSNFRHHVVCLLSLLLISVNVNQIESLNHDSEGKYCVALLSQSPSPESQNYSPILIRNNSDTFRLVNIVGLVSNAPEIVDPVDRLNHPEGTNATFTCSIGSGDLNGLIYEWRKNDQLISLAPKSKKVQIIAPPENFQSILRVINLEPNDAGLYSCTARNKFGQDKVTTQLNVKGKIHELLCVLSVAFPPNLTLPSGCKQFISSGSINQRM